MNHAERMRFMKGAWLRHFVRLPDGGARFRAPGETISDVELKATALRRVDVNVLVPNNCPVPQESVDTSQPLSRKEDVSSALVLGYSTE